MKKLPIYQLEVSMDDDQSGVSFVALVDDPAIQRNFYAFAGQKISFDYDDTLNTPRGLKIAKEQISSGAEVYIISARHDKEGMLGTAKELGIPESRVYATGSNSAKVEKIRELGIAKHYDNNSDVIMQIGDIGQKFKVEPQKNETKDEFVSRCIGVEVSGGMETSQASAVCYAKWDEHKTKFAFAITSDEKKIVSGPLMVAGMPIYRNDANGEYYVQFSAQSIYTIVKKFFKEGNTSNVNEMHNPRMIADGVYMFESFLIDKTRMSNPKGFEDLPDGSWFGSYKVDNEDIWSKIKSGEFKGFSVEGDFIPKEMNKVSEEALISQITAIIQS